MSSMMHDTHSPYWRSLSELADTPEFRDWMAREFPEGASEADGPTRRRFLQLMGASLALAGVAGCTGREQKILPHSRRPDGHVPGVPDQYATAFELGGVATGLLVSSYDGRPIKIDGNPSHPASGGAASALAQASILEMYDPDRSRHPVRRSGSQTVHPTWADFDAFARERFGALRAKGGAGIAVLAEPTSSPTRARIRKEFLAAYPQARWVDYDSVSWNGELAGTRAAFGKAYRVQLDLEAASRIACFDADPLGLHPDSVRHTRGFARGRRPEGKAMNRLYAVESRFSLTGAQADHRLMVRAEQVEAVLLALEAELVGRPALGASAAARAAASALPTKGFLAEPATRKFVKSLADDLAAHRGRSVVAVGASQPPQAHAAAARINELLGAPGATVRYFEEPEVPATAGVEGLKKLVSEMDGGRVDTLVILGGNPAFTAPADVDFAGALKKVAATIRLGLYDDETSRACEWHLPRAHFLEAWGDARASDGTVTILQPLIAPLYDGRSDSEFVAALTAGAPAKGLELVRATYDRTYGGGDLAWKRAIQDGVVPGSAFAAASPRTRPADKPRLSDRQLAPKTIDNGNIEVVFVPDSKVYDGRFANSGWLQELPDFLTKLTWDNALLIGPETAKTLGVAHEEMVRVTLGGRSIEIAAYVMPGQAPGSVTLPLGYGRTAAGQIGGVAGEVEPVGFDTYRLRASDAMGIASGATIEPLGRRHRLATTQDHHLVDLNVVAPGMIEKRMDLLVREADFEEYEKHPDFAKHMAHHPPLESLWTEHQYEGHRWGMAIDLAKCTGCNACVTGCQAENNIPIVGKSDVLKGREMHWIRIDGYFRGGAEDPTITPQPVACHQCEMAPCEQVCPVAATVHSSEGLNDMVYNRCIGTRYCANNCPYKVRRFNFFNYHKNLKDPNNSILEMMYNPDVTVRSRGVMEKCTFCVQRIERARSTAKVEGRPIADGDIVTACAQTCPAEAIVFGDLSDPTSAVSKAQANSRAYKMLEELNVKPRLAYLAKVRNPNPALA